MLNSVTITALVRHFLTMLGGGMLAQAGADPTSVESIVGGFAALAGVLWSLYEKKAR